MIVHHYTVACKIPAILKSGKLIPSMAPVPELEKPALWFSSHSLWEASAARVNGTTMQLFSLMEHVNWLGLCRFTIDTDKVSNVHHASQAIKYLNMDEADLMSLVAAGIRMGAHPDDWWFTPDDMLLEHTKFELIVSKQTNSMFTLLHYESGDPQEHYNNWKASLGDTNFVNLRMSDYEEAAKRRMS